MDIVDAAFGVRRRGGVDLWVDIADIAVVIVSVAGFCNKNSKICIGCQKKTYANLSSANIGTLFSQYHYYCKKNFPREMRGRYDDVMKVCRKTRIKYYYCEKFPARNEGLL